MKRKKSLIAHLLEFLGVYIVSLFVLAALLDDLSVPDEAAFVTAFFLALTIIGAYETGKEQGRRESKVL